MKTLIATLFLLSFSISNAFAWGGYDSTTGAHIDIDSYDHGGTGEGSVEYYDYDSGEYRSGYLDMYPGGSGTLTDDETGESHDVYMD